MLIYNSLTHKKEEFVPVSDTVKLYSCGPTVYGYAHIGNLRTYVLTDWLKRVLIYNGYKLKHVMNITDVGHLTSDADSGEDKIEKASKEQGKTAWEIAEYYSQIFFSDLKKLNVILPDIIAKATDHIQENILLINELEKQGFTYRTSDGIYFDTSKFKEYGVLTGLSWEQLNNSLKGGARIELSNEKKNITDFSLWKFSPADEKRQMEWPSPWGVGFPGWHIECSAINLKYLADAFENDIFYPEKAKTIDFHTGGIDLLPIHHTNEIAQVEPITHKPFIKYWVHGEFLIIKGGRMAKSGENGLTLSTLIEKGYDPLIYRYFLLNAHYRTKMEFDYEGLDAANNSLNSLREFVWNLKNKNDVSGNLDLSNYQKDFKEAVNDDLNFPKALSIVWTAIKEYKKQPEQYNSKKTLEMILDFDKVLGLDLDNWQPAEIPKEIKDLAEKRNQLRLEKKYEEADEIRIQIEKMGYSLKDNGNNIDIQKI